MRSKSKVVLILVSIIVLSFFGGMIYGKSENEKLINTYLLNDMKYRTAILYNVTELLDIAIEDKELELNTEKYRTQFTFRFDYPDSTNIVDDEYNRFVSAFDTHLYTIFNRIDFKKMSREQIIELNNKLKELHGLLISSFGYSMGRTVDIEFTDINRNKILEEVMRIRNFVDNI